MPAGQAAARDIPPGTAPGPDPSLPHPLQFTQKSAQVEEHHPGIKSFFLRGTEQFLLSFSGFILFVVPLRWRLGETQQRHRPNKAALSLQGQARSSVHELPPRAPTFPTHVAGGVALSPAQQHHPHHLAVAHLGRDPQRRRPVLRGEDTLGPRTPHSIHTCKLTPGRAPRRQTQRVSQPSDTDWHGQCLDHSGNCPHSISADGTAVAWQELLPRSVAEASLIKLGRRRQPVYFLGDCHLLSRGVHTTRPQCLVGALQSHSRVGSSSEVDGP